MRQNPQMNKFMQAVQQQAMRDPRVRGTVQMLQNKTPQELQQMALNMCQECRTTPEQVLKQLGIL